MDEFGLIRQYFSGWPASSAVKLGVGDDAAILAPAAGEEWVVCTDTLVEGRHFPASTEPDAIGHKALAVNLSDLAAMGARPVAFLLALTLPAPDEAWLVSFARGLRALAEAHQLALIGGDTTRGPLSITVTAIGAVPSGTGLRRSGAQVGDDIAVSGSLGDAALALRLGERAPPELRVRLDRPEPRLALGQWLRGQANAAIDVSDGLYQDLGHVLAASGVGAELWAERLPASDAFRQHMGGEHALALQLAGGDDYELCFTAAPERMRRIVEAAPVPVQRIGRVVAAGAGQAPLAVLDANGATIAAPTSGYQHF